MINQTPTVGGRLPVKSSKLGGSEGHRFPTIMFLATVIKEYILDSIVFAIMASPAIITPFITAIIEIASLLPPLRVLRVLGPLITSAISVPVFAFGWLLGVFFNIIFAFILGLWFLFRSNRRLPWTWFLTGISIAIVIGFIPGARFIIPEYVIFVLLIYFLERRAAKRDVEKSDFLPYTRKYATK